MQALAEWLDSHKTTDTQGFVTLILDEGTRSMTIKWHQLTPDKEALVREKAKELGVTVTFVANTYDLPTIDAALKRLSDARPALKQEGGSTWARSTRTPEGATSRASTWSRRRRPPSSRPRCGAA